MDYSDVILGGYAARRLRERTASTLIEIGRDRFTRSDLAHVDCFNFFAAARLSDVVNRELQVKDTRDLFENIPPAALALRGVGTICYAVLGALFELKRLGSPSPLQKWCEHHLEKDEHLVTIHTLKEAARKTQRKRKER